MRTYRSLIKAIGRARTHRLLIAEHSPAGYQSVRLWSVGANLAAKLAEWGIEV